MLRNYFCLFAVDTQLFLVLHLDKLPYEMYISFVGTLFIIRYLIVYQNTIR